MAFASKPNRAKRWAIKEIQRNKILSGRFIFKSYQESFAFVFLKLVHDLANEYMVDLQIYKDL